MPETTENYADLDVGRARPHHLLAVPENVTVAEVEALAVARSPRAGRTEGRLRLTEEASLSGPWRVTESARGVLDLPPRAAWAYLLHCPVHRSGPLPVELYGTDQLLDAFAAGLPEGPELEALEHCRAVARRLHGALRVAGSGAVLQPDPGAAVDRTVVSPVWLDPEACVQVLAGVLPGVRALVDVPGAVPSGGGDGPADGEQPDTAGGDALDVPAWSHGETGAADAAALPAQETLTGYGMVAPVPGSPSGTGEMVEVWVEPHAYVPTVLRPADWVRGGVTAYEVRWQPADPEVAHGHRPPLGARRRRTAAAEAVAQAAAVLQAVVGGAVCDDDGFIVGSASPEV